MIVKHQVDLGGGWEDATPINWQDGDKLQVSFMDDVPSATVAGGGGFEWVNTPSNNNLATRMIARLNNGLVAGGVGVFEAIPYQMFIVGSPNIYIFSGAIDGPKARTECDKVTAPLCYINAIDWFHELAKSITPLSLTAQGLASAGIPAPNPYTAYIGLPGSGAKYPYKVVPYVVTQETDIFNAITLLLEEFSMFAHLKTALVNTIACIQKILADLGVTATIAYAPVGIIQGILDVVALIAQLVWDALLILSLIGSIEMLINQCGLIPKYKYAMKVSDIIHASIDFINNYLGTPSGNPITFTSSIFDSGPYANATIMPRKIYKENYSNIVLSALKGGIMDRGNEVGVNNTYGYPDWDFKQTLENLDKVFNSKRFMIGGQVRMEEIHYFIASTYQVPNVAIPANNVQNEPDPNDKNCDETPWNLEIAFQTDPSDERTMIVYTGTTCNVCTIPRIVKNVQYVRPTPGVTITMPFALAKRKEYLNFIESVVNDMLKVVAPVYNAITGTINSIIGIANKINKLFGSKIQFPTIAKMPNNLNALIGCLELSNDTFNIPKIFIGTPVGDLWYVDPNNGANDNGVWNNPNVPVGTPHRGEGWMSTWALMNQFYGKNLSIFTPVDAAGNLLPQINNQWLLYKDKKFPMCAQDFQTLLGNNMFLMPGEVPAKFEKLDFNITDSMAEKCDYRKSKLYTDNIITINTIDGN